MDMNEEKNAADYKDFILPPASLTATQGESKAVVLTWPAVKNAVQYQVFAAESPFSTFSKVSETTSTETEITIEEEAGITKYYCISAVNYYGTVSSKSVVAMGSTLAVPIITAIDASEEGNSVTVSWWMDNCSSDTYAADVSFNVNVYALSAPNIKFKTLTVDGDTRQVEIDGLTSKTEYYFEVEVVKTGSTSKECSEKTSAETAHRVIPDAPQSFTVAQGVSKDKITLSWQLPEMVWYREQSGVSGFALHALYFNIYRKLSTQADSEYTLVHTYHVTPVDNYNLDDYTPGDTVTWDDENAVPEKKYTYYIQSVTDGTPVGKVITADSSKTEAVEGWLVSIPTFSINTDYTKSEDLLSFTKIAFSFNVSFETFGQTYTYFIKREKFDLDNQTTLVPEGEYEWTYTSLSDLNEGKDIFEDPASALGYYKYTLYVCPANSTDSSNAYHSIEASGKFLVTNDANAVPVVEEFNLADGYSNKFVLSFTYHSSYTYTIHWKNVVDGISQTEESLELPASIFENATEDTLFEYEHTDGVNSGDRRIYSLEASMGLSERFRPNTDTTDKVYETLGTAAPVITGYDYDKLLVEWPAVQKAKDEYTVSATYADESDELVIADGDDANCEITKVTDGDSIKFTCVITKPAGYDDAEKSGKTIKFKVTAQNQETTDTTDSTIDVCTVGPALSSVTIDAKNSTYIDVKWTPVDGADGYIIRRITYKIATQHPELINDVSNPDIYYYDVEQDTLTINSETADSSRASVNLVQGSLKLTDTYKEAQNKNDSYEVNQSFIAWGIPYGYTVIPVKHGGSTDDFTIVGRVVAFNGNTYSNVNETFGSTIGYGLNVHAEKSESADTQVLEWDSPYNPATTYSVYYRIAGSSLNSWQFFDKTITPITTNGKQSVSFKPDNQTEAYEYLVAYKQENTVLSGYVPDSFIVDSTIGLSALDTIYDYSRVIDGEKIKEEQSNKGYLLAQKFTPNTAPENVDDYSETITLTAWNYAQRSIGPDKAYLRIKNYNISDTWIYVAELDEKLHFKTDFTVENTTIEKGANETNVVLRPNDMMDGTLTNPVTKGPLQVLRDAKHYYSLEIIRGTNTSIIGGDESKYAYRNISQKELVKCALLNMAYGFYLEAGGKEDLSNVNDTFKYKETKLIFDGTGSATFGKRSEVWESGLKYKADVSMLEFAPLQLTPTGTKSCVVKISITNVSTRTQGGIDAYLDKFRSEAFPVTVTPVDSDMPSSYSAVLTMTCKESGHLLIKIDTTTIVDTENTNANINKYDLRKLYFPIQLADNEHFWGKTKNYGFWTE